MMMIIIRMAAVAQRARAEKAGERDTPGEKIEALQFEGGGQSVMGPASAHTT